MVLPAAAVGLAVLVLIAPLRQPVTAQTSSRYALTAAVVDHGTTRIDRYEEHLSVDFATRGGHLYSDKAPGQPLWAAPVYALHRALGGAPGEAMSQEGYRGVWWSVLWSSALPAAVIAAGATWLLGRRDGALAPVTGFLTVAGTLLLPLGSVLFGHVLAGAAIAAAAVVALWPTESAPGAARLAAAGALAGFAVTTEYAIVWLAAGLAAGVLWQHRRRVLAFLAGAAPFALGLMAYHWVAFGSPFVPSYRYADLGDHTGGVGGILPPDLDTLRGVVVGHRGLVTLTPIVILAVIGLVALVRRRDPLAPFAAFALYGFGVLFLLQIGWDNPTGGHAAGPRYLAPALPLLAPGIAWVWRRWPAPTAVVGLWSVATMWFAAHGDPTLPPARDPALRAWIGDLLAGEGAPALAPLWARLILAAVALGLVAWAASRMRPTGSVPDR